MATRTVDQDISQLRDDLARLRDDIAGLTRTVTEKVAEQAQHQGARLRAAAGSARDSAEDLLQEARARGERGLDSLGREIEERPLTSVLVAFGVGLLVGKLLDR